MRATKNTELVKLMLCLDIGLDIEDILKELLRLYKAKDIIFHYKQAYIAGKLTVTECTLNVIKRRSTKTVKCTYDGSIYIV